MNLRKTLLLSSATAGALAMAGQAAAFAPVWPADGDAANGTDPAGSVVVWHSGATASTFSLQNAVVEAFCNPNQPVDVLEDARTLGKPDFWSVACIAKATLPAPYVVGGVAQKVLWSKRDEGGSGTGVGPLATSKIIGFMKPSTGAGTNCPADSGTDKVFPVATGTGTAGGNTVSANLWNCGEFDVPAFGAEADPAGDAVYRVADIGTSDIEPDKFTTAFSLNVPATDFDLDGVRGPTDTDDILDPHTANGLTKAGVAQLIFNTPVNLLMYQDLQRAQFPVGHPLVLDCNPSQAGYGLITDSAANANSEKCMPSLSASVIRSIFMKGGAIRSSTDFQAETTYGSGVYAALTATGVTDNTIQICRRVNGSGTQAQFNAMHLGYPCDPTGDGFIDTLIPEAESGLTLFVTEGESSGDVEKCSNDFNNATNNTTKNPVPSKFRWAIGIQSLEKNAPSGGAYTNPYRHIKIDGFAPTMVNAHAGQYFNVARQSLQYNTATATTATVQGFNVLKPFIEDPLKLPSLNKTHAFGVSGWLASPSATVTPDSELSFTRPVAWFHRVSDGKVANTCAFPSAFKKTGGTGVDITVAPTNCSSGANTDGDENCYTATP
jgi:hypothetical protein